MIIYSVKEIETRTRWRPNRSEIFLLIRMSFIRQSLTRFWKTYAGKTLNTQISLDSCNLSKVDRASSEFFSS